MANEDVMAGLELLKPKLYSGDAACVSLKGGRCSACGHAFFPMQARGCETCGAHGEALKQTDLGSTGILVSAATVHVHAGKHRTAPFMMGTIDLDSGPRVRTLLTGIPDAEARAGSRVKAVLVETPGRDGGQALDLRFGLA